MKMRNSLDLLILLRWVFFPKITTCCDDNGKKMRGNFAFLGCPKSNKNSLIKSYPAKKFGRMKIGKYFLLGWKFFRVNYSGDLKTEHLSTGNVSFGNMVHSKSGYLQYIIFFNFISLTFNKLFRVSLWSTCVIYVKDWL